MKKKWFCKNLRDDTATEKFLNKLSDAGVVPSEIKIGNTGRSNHPDIAIYYFAEQEIN